MSRQNSTRAGMGRIRVLLDDQRVAFLVVGAINVAIGLCWFAALHFLLGDRISYMLTLVLAYAGAIVCAFILHRRFVFRVSGQIWVDFSRFTVVQTASLATNAVALPLMVEVVGLSVLLAQLVATVIVVVFNYFGHSLFSFRRSHAHKDVGSGTGTSEWV